MASANSPSWNGEGLAERRCADVQDIARRFDTAVDTGELADIDTTLLVR